MAKMRVFLLMAIVGLLPSRADAASYWWGWLEELSGVGNFQSHGASLRLTCFLEDERPKTPCWSDNKDSIRQVLELRGAYYWSGTDRPRFTDVSSDRNSVKAVSGEAFVLFRVNRMVDAGVGAGFITFWGDSFTPTDTYRVTRFVGTPLAVSITPLELGAVGKNAAHPRWRRLVRIRFEEKWLAHGWTGADFGNTQTKSSRSTEFIRRVSLDFDLGVLLGQ